MELALVMLLTGTLAIIALIGSLATEAAPSDGALSDLDRYILDDARRLEAATALKPAEDAVSH